MKEGEGGLRDIHTIGWGAQVIYGLGEINELAARSVLSRERLQDLAAARDFITDVRVHLHALVGKKSDALTFDLQEQIASRLGYLADGHEAAVERFMRDYYTHVYATKNALDYFMSRVDEDLMSTRVRVMTDIPRRVEKGLYIRRGRVELVGTADILARPVLMMRAIEVSALSGLPVSQRGLELIRNNLELVDDGFRRDPQAATSFFRALTAIPPRRSRAGQEPDLMPALDLLEAYLPELAGVRAQVQHDAYHVYTVDVHLVFTLWELKRLAAGEVAGPDAEFDRGIMDEVGDRRILFLASLIHDVGKGKGHDHSRRGAEMVGDLAERLGFSAEETGTLRFLVAEHLFLMETATRRDLTEERLIIRCARRIGDVDRLNMLYLLTVADAKATAEDVYTPWKASLLRDLYSKVYRFLTKSKELASREMAEQTEKLLLEVVGRLEGHLPSEAVDAHVTNMSAHYLSVMTADQVVKHILLERSLEKGQLIWEVENKEEGYCEVTVLTHDRPGLLSRMAGVFTMNHINILGAQVFTRANNVALDVFQVEPPPDRQYPERVWKRVKEDAAKALTGQLALDYRVARKRPLLTTKQTVTRQPDQVLVDNDTSDFYTIVEVITYDRLGLLYAITKALFDLQLSIAIAKISTKVEQVVDVFYVRDFFGQKLENKDHIKELQDAMRFTLSQWGSLNGRGA